MLGAPGPVAVAGAGHELGSLPLHGAQPPLPLMDHSRLTCPGVRKVNFRFGIFSWEPPKDL